MKQRNIKYRPASKPECFNCALCDFTTVSNVKVIKHMKTNHTKTSLANDNVHSNKNKVLNEDMSVCLTSDDEGSNESEGLLTERKLCAECGFEASDEDLLDKHLEEHTKQTCNTLNEEVTTVPKVKPLPFTNAANAPS